MDAEQSTTATSRYSSKAREIEGEAPKVGFHSLPVELVEIILRAAQKKRKRKESAWLVAIVCRSVCKQWRNLLPSPTLEATQYRFDCVAARTGSFTLLRWVLNHGVYLSTHACKEAAMGGSLEMLTWLNSKGLNLETCYYAAKKKGNLEILKWAREQGCPWAEYEPDFSSAHVTVCSVAAKKGDFEMLKWARENGCLWDLSTCKSVASKGNLEMLKWVRANECPWGYGTISAAAAGGHLEVAKWLRENGCGW